MNSLSFHTPLNPLQASTTLAPPSPTQEKELPCLQAYVNGRLSSAHVAAKLHSQNVAALARPFSELANIKLPDQDRINTIIELFRRHHSQHLSRSSQAIQFYPPSTPDDPESRIWALAETPEKFSVYLPEALKRITSGYKTIAFFKKIHFQGSALSPFEHYDLSRAVQIKPLSARTLPVVVNSIKNHANMASYIFKSGLQHVYIPDAPQVFSEEEQIYFQRYYEVLDIVISEEGLHPLQVLAILFDAGNLLFFLHSLEWTHNDAKIANVFLDRNPHFPLGIVGMLNDFDTLSNRWELDCSALSEEIITQRFKADYLGLCGTLDIKCPIADLYNFVQMAHICLSLITEKQCKTIHNAILKKILRDEVPLDLAEESRQKSLDDPLVALQHFFTETFETLCDLNIRFILDLLGKDFTTDLKAEMKKIGDLPDWEKYFPGALARALTKLPKKMFSHDEMKATVFQNPYLTQESRIIS